MPEHSGRKSQASAFSRGRPSTALDGASAAHRVDVRQQVGLALAALEAHPAQPLPRAVVALEELRLGEGGPAQQRQAALVVDDDEADLDLVEEAAHLGGVHVVGQEQRDGTGDAGGELELELADAGGDADDDDLARVDAGLDHARGAVDDAAVELVPGEGGPLRVAVPLALLDHGDLEGTRTGVALEPCERRFVNRHLRPPACVMYPRNVGHGGPSCSPFGRSRVRSLRAPA